MQLFSHVLENAEIVQEIVKHPLKSVQRIAAEGLPWESTSYRILCKDFIVIQNSAAANNWVTALPQTEDFVRDVLDDL